MSVKLLFVGFKAHVIFSLANAADYSTIQYKSFVMLRKYPAVLLVLLPELLFSCPGQRHMLAVGSNRPGNETLRFEPFLSAGCGLRADRKHLTDRLG